MRAKLLNEIFTAEDSDPIKDMGIGNPEKSILPAFVKELAKYGIEAEWYAEHNAGEGFWNFDVNIYNEDTDDYTVVQLSYATDEAAASYEEEWGPGGFSLYNEDGDKDYLLGKSTHDIEPVVKALVKLKYGTKKQVAIKIRETEKKLVQLKNIEQIL